MLKTIRNAIVGMMNRLRMLRSLRPRRAAGERESSLLSTYALHRTGPAGKAHFPAAPDDHSVALVLLEGLFPVVSQTVQGFFGCTLAAHDERIHALVHLLEQRGVLGRGPEVLDHQHALIEGFVIGRGLAELVRTQHLLVAGVAAQLGPAFLHVVADEPFEEFQGLVALLRIAHDRSALAAERGKARLAARAGWIGEETRALGILVGCWIGERREEGEVVHAHRRHALGYRLVVLEEERLAPARRRELVQL